MQWVYKSSNTDTCKLEILFVLFWHLKKKTEEQKTDFRGYGTDKFCNFIIITQYNRCSSELRAKEVVLELEGCWLKTKDRSGAGQGTQSPLLPRCNKPGAECC